jgi:hypothetical protein
LNCFEALRKIKASEDISEFCLIEYVEYEPEAAAAHMSSSGVGVGIVGGGAGSSMNNTILSGHSSYLTSSANMSSNASGRHNSHLNHQREQQHNNSSSGGSGNVGLLVKTRILAPNENLFVLTHVWNQMRTERRDGFKAARVMLSRKHQPVSAKSNGNFKKLQQNLLKHRMSLQPIMPAALFGGSGSVNEQKSALSSSVVSQSQYPHQSHHSQNSQHHHSASAAAKSFAQKRTKSSLNRLVRQKSFEESCEQGNPIGANGNNRRAVNSSSAYSQSNYMNTSELSGSGPAYNKPTSAVASLITDPNENELYNYITSNNNNEENLSTTSNGGTSRRIKGLTMNVNGCDTNTKRDDKTANTTVLREKHQPTDENESAAIALKSKLPLSSETHMHKGDEATTASTSQNLTTNEYDQDEYYDDENDEEHNDEYHHHHHHHHHQQQQQQQQQEEDHDNDEDEENVAADYQSIGDELNTLNRTTASSDKEQTLVINLNSPITSQTTTISTKVMKSDNAAASQKPTKPARQSTLQRILRLKI